MAVYNEILVGRFNRSLQKLFGIKGPPPVPQLSSEVMAVHRLESGVENRYLESWNRFLSGAQLAASAANINGLRMRNPSGSNVVMVLEKLVFNVQTGANGVIISFGSSGSDLTTLFANQFSRLDARGNASPTMVISFQQTPTLSDLGSTGFQVGNIGINGFYEMIVTPNQEIPILPGDAFQIKSTQVNLATAWTWIWRERFLEDSERS